MTTSDEKRRDRSKRLQTEEEWTNCEFIRPLIRLIDAAQAGERKPWLFTAACVRRVMGTPHIGEHRELAERLEQLGDGSSTATEAHRVAAALRDIRLRCTDVMGGWYWQASIDYSEEPETEPYRIAWGTAEAAIIAAGRQTRIRAGLPDDRPEEADWAAEERGICDLIRCVFGNPLRPLPRELPWATPTVIAVARSIYEDRAFDRLPILADALEDAGCADEQSLIHCRNSGLHSRGCWVVDAMLGWR
jgi:hypothetical protein